MRAGADATHPATFDLGRLLRVFAALSVLLLAALAMAPVRARLTEWRSVQSTYNRQARRAGVAPIPISLRQIWKPQLATVDRCTSCHLAADRAAPLAANKLFAAHPPVSHEPREMGCTICHGGQGRATTAAAAHGAAKFCDDLMLPRGSFEAGCGNCHSGLKVGAAKLVQAGRKIIDGARCGDCHRIGFERAPDLSAVGLRGFQTNWHIRHIERSATANAGPWATSFAPLANDEVVAVNEALLANIGAPRLMAGKSLAYRIGCRGCHRIGGIGGDDGPDLSDEGQKQVADLPFAQVAGPRTLDNWLRQHFLDPARVVAKSEMPNLGLSREEADLLTVYVLSLRQRPLPEELVPPDRLRTERLGERDFAGDGESVYGVFCTACHGSRGEGRKFSSLTSVFPAIGEPEFLAVADDSFLRKTLATGRPGRRMAAWGTKPGGLRAQEIDAVIAFLRTLEPTPPTAAEVSAAPLDREGGDRLFADLCSRCHGPGGMGSAVAPPLGAIDNPVTADDSRIYGTVTTGVAGTAMGSFRWLDATALRALIASVRNLPPTPAKRTGWAPQRGDPAKGGEIFAKHCVSCHGPHGESPDAPALANRAFLSAASDGYLIATILRGRGPTKMPHFGEPAPDHPQLTPAEVADLVAFIRSLAR
jgi:mono/diheme cytochrome c family protein